VGHRLFSGLIPPTIDSDFGHRSVVGLGSVAKLCSQRASLNKRILTGLKSAERTAPLGRIQKNLPGLEIRIGPRHSMAAATVTRMAVFTKNRFLNSAG
jgi:hypothetical protein